MVHKINLPAAKDEIKLSDEEREGLYEEVLKLMYERFKQKNNNR